MNKRTKFCLNSIAKRIRFIMLVIFVTIIIAWLLAYVPKWIKPTVTSLIYQVDDKHPEVLELDIPFKIHTPYKGELITVNMTVEVPYLHMTKFKLYVDDCFQELRINGKEYVLEENRDCSPRHHTLDLRRYLQPGTNEIYIRISNKMGDAKFFWEGDRNDRIYTIKNAIMALIIVLAGFIILV